MSSDSTQSSECREIEVRKGQVTDKMPRDAFRERFLARFYDPAFRTENESLARLEAIAWDAYSNAPLDNLRTSYAQICEQILWITRASSNAGG